jgi:kynureninase
MLDEVNQSSSQQLIQFITPRKKDERGCQVSMLVTQRGKEIFNQLAKQGVMADWREPDVIRIAPVPLYNTFQEVWTFANVMKSIIS